MRKSPGTRRRSARGAATVALLAGATCVLASCNQSISAPCKGVPSRAIIVAVRDSVTGAAAANGAEGTVETAGITDSLQHADSVSMFGGSRLGSYDITIQKPGYQTWTASNVDVTVIGSCGIVASVHVDAKLQPLAP